MKQQLRLEMQLCLEERINGFYYPFAKKLLDLLVEMEANGTAYYEYGGNQEMSELAQMFVRQLSAQVYLDADHGPSSYWTFDKKSPLSEFIENVSSFLDKIQR